ncbi:ATP synthase F1 subunit delta [Bergeyella sp. RCAD1439]|uniref:ATP synthase F1 subunit delta n=1 Tax=Bergeyella anatis TaxID=3113737 RepID=UPI002E194B2D|nr:ATP synthase F1 subunit delta [Bergeyella sp. RCAD1439]
MRTSKVAKRYAQGFLDFAQESGQTSTVFAEMKEVVKIMDESRELNRFFETPVIDSKKKMTVAGEIFKAFSPSTLNMIRLVIRQGREGHLRGIAQEFINKVDDLSGVKRVTLTSAVALSQSNIDQILKTSGLLASGAKFDLTTRINPDILGGYILRVGDQQIDASVKSKLNQIKKEFQLN